MTDAEGAYLGRQLEKHPGELNMLLLASLGIHFSIFCSQQGLKAVRKSGIKLLF